jgi:hypothetical protein
LIKGRSGSSRRRRKPKDNASFAVTNRRGSPRHLCKKVHCDRGEIENRLKKLHHGLKIDPTSGTSFLANQLRVLLTAAAHVCCSKAAPSTHVVARSGSELFFFHRDDSPRYQWHGPEPLSLAGPEGAFRRASGFPSLVFQPFGPVLHGYEQLVTPLADGGFAHLTRDNNSATLPWRWPAVISELGPIAALSLIHSNFSSTNSGVGNPELVALFQNQLFHFWREDNIQIAGDDRRSWFGPWLVTW